MRMFISVASVWIGLAGVGAFGAESGTNQAPSKKPPVEVSKEQRDKMADMHSKMADCLRSDKSISECRQEMMKGCQEAMGKAGCPQMMMGAMHMGGHMKGQMGGVKGSGSGEEAGKTQ